MQRLVHHFVRTANSRLNGRVRIPHLSNLDARLVVSRHEIIKSYYAAIHVNDNLVPNSSELDLARCVGFYMATKEGGKTIRVLLQTILGLIKAKNVKGKSEGVAIVK